MIKIVRATWSIYLLWLVAFQCRLWAVWRLNTMPKDIHSLSRLQHKDSVAQSPAHLTWILIFAFTFVAKLYWWTLMVSAFCNRIGLSQSYFFEYMVVNMNGGHSFSLPEAKNHICSIGGAQSVSQILIEAGTKLNCMTFEWSLGNQPALGVEGSAVAPRIFQARGLWWGAGVQRNLKRTCSLSRLKLMRGINCRLSAFSECGCTKFG